MKADERDILAELNLCSKPASSVRRVLLKVLDRMAHQERMPIDVSYAEMARKARISESKGLFCSVLGL